MNKLFFIIKLFFIVSTLGMAQDNFILLNKDSLNKIKLKIEKKDPFIMPAFTKLILDAEEAMKEKELVVTTKKVLPSSGNKHDYLSFGPYWWPNPDSKTGLPYIQKDGQVNPESKTESDSPKLSKLARITEILSLSYFYTGDYEFAKQTLKKVQYKRLASHIGSKGQNFHELERTRPLHYSIFDLEALISLALYSDRFEEIDFWEFTANKASLKKVEDFIVKYKQNPEEWIKKNEKVDYRSFAGILLIALQKYNDKSYITVIDKLWKLDSENINYLKWNINI